MHMYAKNGTCVFTNMFYGFAWKNKKLFDLHIGHDTYFFLSFFFIKLK